MKLLVDVSLSPDWVTMFLQAGMEAVHWATLGRADAPDHAIAEYAVRHGYAIVTHDLDFSAMLFASGAQLPSVVQIRSSDVHAAAIADAVVLSLEQNGIVFIQV